MESRTLTIMFTDMKGFSNKTSTQSRAATVDMIKQHKQLLLPVIQERGGNLVKTIGDAFLVTFESPTDAVLAGMALQQTLAEHNESVSKDQMIEIRIAINTGEVGLEDGDVYGEAVNIASRLQGFTHANEINFTEATQLSMNKSEVPFIDLGYKTLKGIPDKIKIFKVMQSGAQGDTLSRGTPGLRMASTTPFLRRMAAFGMDLVLVGFVVWLFLMRGAGEIEAQRANLNVMAEELQPKILEAVATNSVPGLKLLGEELEGRRLKMEEKGRVLERRRQELDKKETMLHERYQAVDREFQSLGFIANDSLIKTRRSAGGVSRDPMKPRPGLMERKEILEQDIKKFERRKKEFETFESSVARDIEVLERDFADYETNYNSQLEKAFGSEEAHRRLEAVLFGTESIPKKIPYKEEIREFRQLAQEIGVREESMLGQFLIFLIVLFLEYSIIAMGWKGRTLGMGLMKLRLLRLDGKPAGWKKSFFRSFLTFVSLLLFGIGFFWAFLDPHRRALHDKILKTYVMYEGG